MQKIFFLNCGVQMTVRQIVLISLLTIFCAFKTTFVLADSVMPERGEIEQVLEAVKETTKNNPPKRQNNYDTKTF